MKKVGVLGLTAAICASALLTSLIFLSFQKDSPKNQEEETPSYETFQAVNQALKASLEQTYAELLQPPTNLVTAYSANENGEWAADDMDQLPGGDASQPLKQEYELIDAKAGFYTKIVLTYAPQLTQKGYLNVNRLYGTETPDTRLPKGAFLPDWAINTLSVRGVFIEIITTPIYTESVSPADSKQVGASVKRQDQMVEVNAKVTLMLQQFFDRQTIIPAGS